MSIDWKALVEDAVAAGARAVGRSAPQAHDFLREIAVGHAPALAEIGEAFVCGDIEQKTFESALDDEADALAIELQTAAGLTPAGARRAIRAFRASLLEGVGRASKMPA